MAIVTLLTDFGLADTYVGQMKAAVLSVAPTVTLVDLTHLVPPQDVRAGAYLLWAAVEPFPPGSVHVAVVDPGVGSARRAVAAASARGDRFVGPDNGLLLPALDRLGGCRIAVALDNSSYWRAQRSNTFHGRDVFAPVAAHMANGLELESFGTPVQLQRPFELGFTDGPNGEVIHVDTYGNLVTNLRASRLPTHYEVQLGSRRVRAVPYYAAATPGELVALIGSSGLLEVSVRDGNAATLTGLKRGDRVKIL